MPIPLRVVEPVNVSLDRLNIEKTRDELQCVANGTLANLVRQLSSLSMHGEQMFNDMFEEMNKVNQKLDDIALRTARLYDKVHQTAGVVPQSGRLADNNLRKPYRSQNIIDQHTLSRQTMPRAMVELYDKCDPPPALYLFDEFRKDNKPALKYYTDPGYFFELWKQEILKECGIDRKIQKNRPQPNMQRPKQEANRRVVHNARTLLNHYSEGQGHNQNNLVQFPTEYQVPQINRHALHHAPNSMIRHPQMMRPTQPAPPLPDHFDDDPLPPPPMPTNRPVEQYFNDLTMKMDETASSDARLVNTSNTDSDALTDGILNIDDDDLPPPPPVISSTTIMSNTTIQFLPPPTSLAQNLNYGNLNQHGENLNGNGGSLAVNDGNLSSHDGTLTLHDGNQSLSQNHSTNGQSYSTNQNYSTNAQTYNSGQNLPPAPPPPPPVIMMESVVQSSFTVQLQQDPSQENIEVQEEEEPENSRSNLLDQIKAGYKLRKVERQQESEKAKAAVEANDVAAILRRRMEHVMGNDDSDEEQQSDGSEWE